MLVENHRPFSTLPSLSKKIERLIHSRLYSYILKYNILYENQLGFQKYKSTSDAILKFTNFCYTAINNQEITLSIFLDFSKAFDTIDHEILLKKI